MNTTSRYLFPLELESDLISPYARDELTPVRQDRLGLRLHRAAMAEDCSPRPYMLQTGASARAKDMERAGPHADRTTLNL
jgi:hypothetical protein